MLCLEKQCAPGRLMYGASTISKIRRRAFEFHAPQFQLWNRDKAYYSHPAIGLDCWVRKQRLDHMLEGLFKKG